MESVRFASPEARRSGAARAALALLAWWPLSVYPVSGKTLAGWCEEHLREIGDSVTLSPARSSTGAACLGYVAAVTDTVKTAREWDQWPIDICAPAGTPTVELAKVFVAWSRRNPSRLERLAANGLVRALNEAYRCD